MAVADGGGSSEVAEISPVEAKVSDATEVVGAERVAQPARDGLKIIRATQIEEMAAIKDIAHEFHAESRYGHLPFSEEKFARFCSSALARPEDTVALYVQYDGKAVGVLTAGAGDYYLTDGGRMATVYVMYVSASIRETLLGGKIGMRLIRIVSEWARSQRAEELHIHSTSGIDPERTDKLLRRLGFKAFGGNYAVQLR